MATYVLQNSAQQIDQAVTAAYSSLVLGGTGLARITGNQTISGVKTFADQAVFSSGAILNGSTQLNGAQAVTPTGDAAVDLGGMSNRFKTGWFSGVSGFTGVFQNLTILGTLNATIPAPILNNSTGNNVTLSGTTNLNAANFSGNINSAGTNTFSGNLNVSGASIFNGTITATGNKTFSGNLSQTGNSNFFGAFNQSGTLNSTGSWTHTGTVDQIGDVTFKGNTSIDGSNSSFNFTGTASNFNVVSNFGVSGVTNITGNCNITGTLHVIRGDIVHTGTFSHSGATTLIGETRNTGRFSVIGNTTFSGNNTLTGRSTVTSGISLSGTSSAPALLLNRNLTTAPSGGAIEYGSNGLFYFTNEISGAPNRTALNPVYSYVAPQPFFVGNGTSGTINTLLGSTGIYLNTGTYHIYYNTRLTKGTSNRAINLGITGSSTAFTHRFGLVEKRHDAAASSNRPSFNITGTDSVASVFASGNTDANSLVIDTSSASDVRYLGNFVFDCVVTITGATKVRPYFRFVENIAAEAVTGTQFNMRVTQLTTGTGIGLTSASGPWSDQ